MRERKCATTTSPLVTTSTIAALIGLERFSFGYALVGLRAFLGASGLCKSLDEGGIDQLMAVGQAWDAGARRPGQRRTRPPRRND